MKIWYPVAAIAAFCVHAAVAQPVVEPGGRPQDQALALTNPDEHAWQLFMFLNRPAKPGMAGVADDSKQFGNTAAGLSMVWETWALASGGTSSEVFKPNGARPDDWDKLKRNSRELILDRNVENEAVRANSRRVLPSNVGAFFPPRPEDQEVRMNKGTFDLILSREMYHRGGLESLWASAASEGDRGAIQFSTDAKEVKAQWLRIEDAQKSRYLWREKTTNGVREVYGLVALHIITKDLPNWFWADFGHIDCESQLNACAIAGQEPALTPLVDRTTRGRNGGAGPAGKDGVRNETVGTVFANYVLRGTQIDFVTPTGVPTILSNPVIENGFQRSSCLTCHARAAVGPRQTDANGKPIAAINRLSPGDPEIGAPNPALFGDGSGFDAPIIRYLQTDFLWSPVFRAQRRPN